MANDNVNCTTRLTSLQKEIEQTMYAVRKMGEDVRSANKFHRIDVLGSSVEYTKDTRSNVDEKYVSRVTGAQVIPNYFWAKDSVDQNPVTVKVYNPKRTPTTIEAYSAYNTSMPVKLVRENEFTIITSVGDLFFKIKNDKDIPGMPRFFNDKTFEWVGYAEDIYDENMRGLVNPTLCVLYEPAGMEKLLFEKGLIEHLV